MKKLVALVLSVVMAISMTVAASAVFVASPSLNKAPVLIEVKGGEENLKIKITSYLDRATLGTEGKVAIESSYDDIKNAKDVTDITADIKAVADKAGAKVADLKVSDLFDISVEEGEIKGDITIILSAETLKNFVALLHDNDGKWEVVQGAKVKGDQITFSVDSLSPFAIVVNTAEKDSPSTGNTVDYGMIFVVAALVFGGAAVFCLAKSKKKVND